MKNLSIVTIGSTLAFLGMLGLTSIADETTLSANDMTFIVISAAMLLGGVIIFHIPVWRN